MEDFSCDGAFQAVEDVFLSFALNGAVAFSVNELLSISIRLGEAAIRKSSILIAMAVFLALLSACATSAPSAPVPSSSETEAADASEPPERAKPARIVIGSETTDILDENGNVLVSLQYSGDGGAAVSAATDVLGTPLDTHHQEGTSHNPAVDGTSWGGFDIIVNRYSEKLDPTDEERLYLPAFTVQATAESTDSGIEIAAVDGTRVGDAFDVVAEGKPTSMVHLDDSFGIRSVALDLPTSFPGIVDPGIEMAYGVIGRCEKGASSLTSITAPTYLFSLS